jgi:hypothetical protein
MPDSSKQATMPRSALPTGMPSNFAVVFWVAFSVSTMLVVGQIAFIMSLTPMVVRMAENSSATLPPLLAAGAAMGPIGLFLFFAIGDALIFAAFAWLAKHNWIGLLFVPPILYLAGAFGALWIYVAQYLAQS